MGDANSLNIHRPRKVHPCRLLALALVLLAGGCGQPAATVPAAAAPLPSTETTLSEQIAAVQAGTSDIILLENTSLQDADLKRITPSIGLAVLQLDSPDNEITDAGMQTLASLRSLVQLRIRGGKIGDAGLWAIANLPELKILNLPQGVFTDAGLAELRQLPKLELLRIGSPRITDAGVASLRQFPSLRQIHLINVVITDRSLVELQKIDRLESLYLDHSQVSDQAIEALIRARPHLHLHLNQQHHDRDPQKANHRH